MPNFLNRASIHRLLLALLLPIGLVAWRLAYEPDVVTSNPYNAPFADQEFSASFLNEGQSAIFTWKRFTFPPFSGSASYFPPRIHQIIMPLDTGIRHWITKWDFDRKGNFTWDKHPRLRRLLPNENERIIRALYSEHSPSNSGRFFENRRFAFELRSLTVANNPFGKYDGVDLVELDPNNPRTVESREKIAEQVRIGPDEESFVAWNMTTTTIPGSAPIRTYSISLRSLRAPRTDVAIWIASNSPVLTEDTVITLAEDKQSSEIRSLENGALVQRIEHGTVKGLNEMSPQAIYPEQKRILFFSHPRPTSAQNKRPTSTILFDYEKNELIQEYEGFQKVYVFTRSSDRFALLRSRDLHRVKVINVSTGETIFEDSYEALGSRFCDIDNDGKHLIVARPECTVQFIDLETGEVTRHVGVQAWRTPVFYGLLVLFTIWCITWLYTGSDAASARTFDVLVIQMAVFCGVVMDQQLAGVVNSFERSDMPLALGILSGWGCLAAIWSVEGDATRFVKIASITIGGVAFVVGFAQIYSVGFDHATLYFVTLFCLIGLATSIPGFLGMRLVPTSGESNASLAPRTRKNFQLKILDLMAITLIAALFCAVPWRAYSLNSWLYLLLRIGLWLTYCLVVGSLLLRWAFGRADWQSRTIALILAVTMVAAVGFLVFTNVAQYNDPSIWSYCAAANFNTAFTITVMPILSIYRSANWRFVSISR